MTCLFWLIHAQLGRVEPFFPKCHGKPRLDHRRVLSGIIFPNRNGLQWRNIPAAYEAHKAFNFRCKRRSDKGIFAPMMADLAAKHGEKTTVMIDASYPSAHRTPFSPVVKMGT